MASKQLTWQGPNLIQHNAGRGFMALENQSPNPINTFEAVWLRPYARIWLISRRFRGAKGDYGLRSRLMWW